MGGEVLYRPAYLGQPSNGEGRWRHPPLSTASIRCHDIIGYTKRAEPEVEALVDPFSRGFAKGFASYESPKDALGRFYQELASILGDEVAPEYEGPKWTAILDLLAAPDDFAIVKRMTEVEARKRWVELTWSLERGWDNTRCILTEMSIIKPESLAEKFTRETGIAITPEIERALSWASEVELTA